ncbi:MAG: type II secretion system F family protein [Candidatus Kerfeldbacteria bacterium]|nr:type II secretion system F family protein [Candidatus Kerfeldbacteria bacterium]
MPRYTYQAFNTQGEPVTGGIEASSAVEAKQALEQKNVVVQSLREVGARQRWLSLHLSFSISTRELTFFTKNFAVMLNAGLTVVEALIIAEAQSTGKLKTVLHNVLRQVESGHSLADSFGRYQRYFSAIYIDVIRTGELSGRLARNFDQLANQLENDLALRKKIQAALIYPIIVLAAIIGLGIILSVFVLPRLTRLFVSLQVPIPRSTEVLLWIADAMSHYWYWWLAFGIMLVVLTRLALMLPTVKNIWHHLILWLPIVGPIVRNVNISRFTATLGSLLQSGVPIAESLTSVMHSSTSLVYRRVLRLALQHIEQGGNLASFLSDYPRLFPPIVTRMVAVGERTGRLEGILQYLGKYFDLEVDAATKQLSVTLEPVLLLVIGAVVLFVGISIITPIYQFTASVGKL